MIPKKGERQKIHQRKRLCNNLAGAFIGRVSRLRKVILIILGCPTGWLYKYFTIISTLKKSQSVYLVIAFIGLLSIKLLSLQWIWKSITAKHFLHYGQCWIIDQVGSDINLNFTYQHPVILCRQHHRTYPTVNDVLIIVSWWEIITFWGQIWSCLQKTHILLTLPLPQMSVRRY